MADGIKQDQTHDQAEMPDPPGQGGNGAANGAVIGTAEASAPDVAALAAERDEFLDQLQRSRAEFANYRRRIEQERVQLVERANHHLLTQLLPVVDDFQRALAAIPEDQRETPWVQGITMIERKLWGILERAGVTALDALGERFDPAQHEAVDTEAGDGSGAPIDTVVAVYQPGYRLGERLLRPAMVKVGRKPAGAGRPA